MVPARARGDCVRERARFLQYSKVNGSVYGSVAEGKWPKMVYGSVHGSVHGSVGA